MGWAGQNRLCWCDAVSLELNFLCLYNVSRKSNVLVGLNGSKCDYGKPVLFQVLTNVSGRAVL